MCAQVDELVLVGGSTRLPFIRARLATLFRRTPNCALPPEEAVARGAAIQAGILVDAGSIPIGASEAELGMSTRRRKREDASQGVDTAAAVRGRESEE